MKINRELVQFVGCLVLFGLLFGLLLGAYREVWCEEVDDDQMAEYRRAGALVEHFKGKDGDGKHHGRRRRRRQSHLGPIRGYGSYYQIPWYWFWGRPACKWVMWGGELHCVHGLPSYYL